MRTRITAALLTGTLATGGVGALALMPASAATTAGTPVATRLEHLKADLAGLVSDGTLTYAQADKVAATLASEWPRGRGHSGGPAGLRHDHRLRAEEAAAAAKALGLSRRALRAEVRSGKSLAEVADARHVSVTTLVNDLVAVAKTRLGAALRSGRLTQTQAVRISAHLPTRITRRVDRIPQARAAQGSRPANSARGARARLGPSGHGGSGAAA